VRVLIALILAAAILMVVAGVVLGIVHLAGVRVDGDFNAVCVIILAVAYALLFRSVYSVIT
jgi:hypothetical protein